MPSIWNAFSHGKGKSICSFLPLSNMVEKILEIFGYFIVFLNKWSNICQICVGKVCVFYPFTGPRQKNSFVLRLIRFIQLSGQKSTLSLIIFHTIVFNFWCNIPNGMWTNHTVPTSYTIVSTFNQQNDTYNSVDAHLMKQKWCF